MAFVLFLLVNAALFIRPSEIVPAWQGWEIYFYLIVACTLAAVPDVLRLLGPGEIGRQPVSLCVLGLLVMVFLAPLVGLDVAESWRTGWHFTKVVVYYVLFVSLVTTPFRLRVLLGTLLVCCFALTALAVLKYHGLIALSTIESLRDSFVGNDGQVHYFQRLQGTGIFFDPNELGVMLTAMVPLALYFLVADRNHLRRGLWLACLLLFGYAIYLTHSRGALLALLAGLGVCAWARFGWQRTLLLGSLGLPALLFLFAGRQTDIDVSKGTGQTRVQLWSDWLMEFRTHPVFGKGMSLAKEEELQRLKLPGAASKHMAHNSYLQAFADVGFLGGCLFLGAFGLALGSVYRLRRENAMILDEDQRRLHPFVSAALTAYAVGLLSLSLVFVIPTYVMLGLASVYVRMTPSWPPPPPLRLDGKALGRVALAGVAFLIATYVFVRLFVNWA